MQQNCSQSQGDAAASLVQVLTLSLYSGTHMKSIVGVFSLLILASCASAPVDSVATKGETVCENSAATGSTIARKHCYTAEEQEQQQQAVRDMGDAINRTHTTSSSSNGQ
jgi:hypothetical protein